MDICKHDNPIPAPAVQSEPTCCVLFLKQCSYCIEREHKIPIFYEFECLSECFWIAKYEKCANERILNGIAHTLNNTLSANKHWAAHS